jgi:tryptophanyl-tRNA synthetase
MRRSVVLMIAVAVCAGLVSSCTCPKSKSASCATTKCPVMGKSPASIDQCPVMSKLNLTAAQKVEVQKICDKCAGTKCSKKACKEMTAELEKVLTPEQMAQYKAACAEMKKKGCGGEKAEKSEKSGCPMKKSEESK